MKRGGIDFSYANNVVAAKRFDNRRVTMVGTCLVKFNKVSIVTRRVGVVLVHDTRSNDSRFMHKFFACP